MQVEQIFQSFLDLIKDVAHIKVLQQEDSALIKEIRLDLVEFNNTRFLDQWIRVEKAAQQLGLSKRWFQKEIREGRITVTHVSKKNVFIDQQELTRLMEHYKIEKLKE